MTYANRIGIGGMAAALVALAPFMDEASADEKTPYAARVARDRAVVRAQANGTAHELGTVGRDRTLIVTEVRGDWAKVEVPSDIHAFISEKWVTRSGKDQGQVAGSRVNVRSAPNADSSAILTTLEKGDEVRIVGATDGWLEILAPDAVKAYVQKSVLEYEGPATSALRDEARRGAAQPTGAKPTTPAGRRVRDARAAFEEETRRPEGSRDFSRVRRQLPSDASAEDAADVATLLGELDAAEGAESDFRTKLAENEKKREELNQLYQKRMGEIEALLEDLRKPKEPEPFSAIGIFRPLGLLIGRPGTHQIVAEDGTPVFLRSATLELYTSRWYGKKIGVRGQVVEMPRWGRVIEVHEIQVLDGTTRR
ncbi:MAG: SH3 domain-containing protein [Planctomycetales bacterium]|nr:SH3 domain-containing protein [Planctomycetales bacterium]